MTQDKLASLAAHLAAISSERRRHHQRASERFNGLTTHLTLETPRVMLVIRVDVAEAFYHCQDEGCDGGMGYVPVADAALCLDCVMDAADVALGRVNDEVPEGERVIVTMGKFGASGRRIDFQREVEALVRAQIKKPAPARGAKEAQARGAEETP